MQRCPQFAPNRCGDAQAWRPMCDPRGTSYDTRHTVEAELWLEYVVGFGLDLAYCVRVGDERFSVLIKLQRPVVDNSYSKCDASLDYGAVSEFACNRYGLCVRAIAWCDRPCRRSNQQSHPPGNTINAVRGPRSQDYQQFTRTSKD
jgi:hypothetical protein